MDTHDRSRDEAFMNQAIELAANCKSERSDRPSPLVAAVVVLDGEVKASAFRGERNPGEHAEFLALELCSDPAWLHNATVYTTLEPCTQRGKGKMACAHRLLQRGVGRVVIGMLDPNPAISGKGVRQLRKSRRRVELFPAELMQMVESQNAEFIDYWEREPSPQDEFRDYRVQCNRCFGETRHRVLFEHAVDHGPSVDPETGIPEEPWRCFNHRILECCGCSDLTYQIEDREERGDEEDDYCSSRYFPPRLVTPNVVREYGISREVYESLDLGHTLLPILGLVHDLKRFARQATQAENPQVEDIIATGKASPAARESLEILLNLPGLLLEADAPRLTTEKVVRALEVVEDTIRANRGRTLSYDFKRAPRPKLKRGQPGASAL